MNVNMRLWDWHDGRKGSDHCIVFGTLTPMNEFFCWDELKLPHATHTTEMIVAEIVKKSGNIKYLYNLIDPLAHKIQSNVNFSVVDDINQHYHIGYWETWDSKSMLGRDELRKRLRNSFKCKEAYNNVEESIAGEVKYLPTIWVNYEKCPNIRKSIAKWSLDKKGEPAQAHSHFCTAIEGGFKDIRFKARMNVEEFETHNPYAKYFRTEGSVAV